MHTISQLQEKVNKQLSELHIKPSPAHLYDPIKYMLGLEAKRTRPVLVLMSCELFGGNIDAAGRRWSLIPAQIPCPLSDKRLANEKTECAPHRETPTKKTQAEK